MKVYITRNEFWPLFEPGGEDYYKPKWVEMTEEELAAWKAALVTFYFWNEKVRDAFKASGQDD